MTVKKVKEVINADQFVLLSISIIAYKNVPAVIFISILPSPVIVSDKPTIVVPALIKAIAIAIF